MKKLHFALSLPMALLLLTAQACQSDTKSDAVESGSTEAEPEGGRDVEVAAELLPTPFTADQIRSGCMPGSQVVFRIDVQGQPPINQYMRFTADDGENATVESWVESLDGQPLGPRESQVQSWSELRDHALLPLGSTRERATVTVEQGTHEGWNYVEPIEEDGRKGTRSYWFADRFPGPPVLLTKVLDGKEVMRTELIARVMP